MYFNTCSIIFHTQICLDKWLYPIKHYMKENTANRYRISNKFYRNVWSLWKCWYIFLDNFEFFIHLLFHRRSIIIIVHIKFIDMWWDKGWTEDGWDVLQNCIIIHSRFLISHMYATWCQIKKGTSNKFPVRAAPIWVGRRWGPDLRF